MFSPLFSRGYHLTSRPQIQSNFFVTEKEQKEKMWRPFSKTAVVILPKADLGLRITLDGLLDGSVARVLMEN